MTAAAWSVRRPRLNSLPSSRSGFNASPAPYLTKTERRMQAVCRSCAALSRTGRLIGTEWRVLARSLHAGVTLWEEEEEEEERTEGRKSGCLGFYLTSQLPDTVAAVQLFNENCSSGRFSSLIIASVLNYLPISASLTVQIKFKSF